MTKPEDDSLLVEYDEDTGTMKIEWDDKDPKWNWLNSLDQKEVNEVISTNLSRMLSEHEGDN
tara:strand:+ start:2206 stop:2391 length:186 start_codon:yes stop_codon:yes gene_type:complete